MTDVVWEDPPVRVPRGGINDKQRALLAFADVLRENPGKWALYPHPTAGRSTGNGRASQIRTGKWGPGVGFEATCREINGEVRIYVRFVAS